LNDCGQTHASILSDPPIRKYQVRRQHAALAPPSRRRL
jgi:hypothetical protein